MKKKLFVISVILWCLVCSAPDARAQQLALETDAVMLGTLVPNLGVELITGEKTSLSFTALGTYKPYGLSLKGWGVRPEFKFWLAGRPMIREYIGVMALFGQYDCTFDGTVRDGVGMGVGITGGYSFKLSQKFCLELSAGMGVVSYSQRLYPEGMKYEDLFAGGELVRDNSTGCSLIPMKLGVTFVWLMR